MAHADEDIPTDSTSPTLHDEQANQIRLGPITRARAKLIEQQVNLLLIESDVVLNENFILPESLFVCMIRYHGQDEEHEGEDEARGEEAMEQGQVIPEEEPREDEVKKLQHSGSGTTALQSGTTARRYYRPYYHS